MPRKPAPASLPPIVNGTDWRDTDGRPIKAHGGGLLKHRGIYYWYGEEHSLGFGNKMGVVCYRSRDLLDWECLSVALPKEALPEKFRDQGVCERPKVLHCPATGQFVMWMHLDAEHYTERLAGVAVAEDPAGPFILEDMFRPIAFDYGGGLLDGGGTASSEGDRQRLAKIDEAGRGNTFADFNLFQDTDGTAWVFYASECNSALYISKLREDYLGIEQPAVQGKTWARTHVQRWREAPAPFKFRGRYYLFSSGCTGWSPNPMLLSSAQSPLGPWLEMGNPCRGPGREVSFQSQPTYVLPAPHGPNNAFIYCGDRWDPNDIRRATYVWLPFFMKPSGEVRLDYLPQWDFSVFSKRTGKLTAPVLQLAEGARGQPDRLVWKPIPGADYYRIYRNGEYAATTGTPAFVPPPMLPGKAVAWTALACTVAGAQSKISQPVFDGAVGEPKAVFLSDYEPDNASQGYGSLGRDHNVMGGPLRINGKVYAKGLGTHAMSEVVYRIGGVFSKLTAVIGLDDSHQGGSVVFMVVADDTCLYHSDVIRSGDKTRKIKLDITGTFELKLLVIDAGDGIHGDHANWCEALLEP